MLLYVRRRHVFIFIWSNLYLTRQLLPAVYASSTGTSHGCISMDSWTLLSVIPSCRQKGREYQGGKRLQPWILSCSHSAHHKHSHKRLPWTQLPVMFRGFFSNLCRLLEPVFSPSLLFSLVTVQAYIISSQPLFKDVEMLRCTKYWLCWISTTRDSVQCSLCLWREHIVNKQMRICVRELVSS